MVKDSAYIANITKGEWIIELKYLYGFRVLRLCFWLLSNLKVAIVGQRSDEALSLLYPEALPHTINLQRGTTE